MQAPRGRIPQRDGGDKPIDLGASGETSTVVPRLARSCSILGPASSREFTSSENSDRRAFGNECGARLSLKDAAQLDAIQLACVTIESCRRAYPHSPRHMRNVIFEGAPASLRRVTPIVFGNKLFQAALSR